MKIEECIADTEDELRAAWLDLQDRSCSCHINPPCSACVDGKGLDIDEYIDAYWPADIQRENPNTAMLARDEVPEETKQVLTREPKETPWYSRITPMSERVRDEP